MSEAASQTTLRRANVRDVPEVLEIINRWAGLQEMLPRSPLSLYESIRDFRIAEHNGIVVGCGALHVVWGNLAEIRSIAVLPSEKGKGTGRALARAQQDAAPGARRERGRPLRHGRGAAHRGG